MVADYLVAAGRLTLMLAAGGVVISVAYLWVLALASVRQPRKVREGQQRTRFAVLIPAHDEAATIGATVHALTAQDYPHDRFAVHVVADHCSDDTATVARTAGAHVAERDEGPRGSKGAALAWLMDRTIEQDPTVDACVIFDADTRVEPQFLHVMDSYLDAGENIVQGRHAISNPDDGSYAALHDAMMRIDNRFGNQGRSNLGLSAKHMGDSIVFRTTVIRQHWRESGLTEDYALRQHLILAGLRIEYAPQAVGWGEAPATWEIARMQRARWLSGTRDSNRRHGRALLRVAVRRRDRVTLDGTLQALLPVYSTQVILALIGVVASLIVWPTGVALWTGLLVLLGLYPFFGLLVEGAPLSAYRALVAGPAFILWRTGLSVLGRLPGHEAVWRRTPRRSGG